MNEWPCFRLSLFSVQSLFVGPALWKLHVEGWTEVRRGVSHHRRHGRLLSSCSNSAGVKGDTSSTIPLQTRRIEDFLSLTVKCSWQLVSFAGNVAGKVWGFFGSPLTRAVGCNCSCGRWSTKTRREETGVMCSELLSGLVYLKSHGSTRSSALAQGDWGWLKTWPVAAFLEGIGAWTDGTLRNESVLIASFKTVDCSASRNWITFWICVLFFFFYYYAERTSKRGNRRACLTGLLSGPTGKKYVNVLKHMLKLKNTWVRCFLFCFCE